MDPDPGGPKTCGSGGSGTLGRSYTQKKFKKQYLKDPELVLKQCAGFCQLGLFLQQEKVMKLTKVVTFI
jgi:hypothetical protein